VSAAPRTAHPSAIALEALACGEDDAVVAGHVATCAECRAHVDALRALLREDSSSADAERLVTRAAAHDEPRLAPAPLADARRRKAWLLASSVVAPLAAAAALLLLLQPPRPPHAGEGTTANTASRATSAVAAATPPGSEAYATTFKGSAHVAVVRDRRGDQARLVSPTIRVSSGDRLRLEVALDREEAILGAVIADDGSYLEIMPAAVRGPGTHFSEKAAGIDAHPTAGTLVVGTPEEVQRARATKRFDRVLTVRIEPDTTGARDAHDGRDSRDGKAVQP